MLPKSWTPYTPPEDYKLVYQGGHHNVYCNGSQHIWTTGGRTKIGGIHFVRDGKCDCASEWWKYKA